MPMYIDEFGDRFITDGMFETLRLAPAPGRRSARRSGVGIQH
jgi:hypothetical protein